MQPEPGITRFHDDPVSMIEPNVRTDQAPEGCQHPWVVDQVDKCRVPLEHRSGLAEALGLDSLAWGGEILCCDHVSESRNFGRVESSLEEEETVHVERVELQRTEQPVGAAARHPPLVPPVLHFRSGSVLATTASSSAGEKAG